MRVPADHRPDPGRNRIEIQRHPVVKHVDRLPAQLHQLRLRKPPASPAPIYIAPNRRHRSDMRQPVQNLRLAHVSRMENVLDILQRRHRLRPKQPMRIRDHAHTHGYSPTSIRVRGSR